MASVNLTRGFVAQVDDDDYAELIKYYWCAIKDGNTYYASRTESTGKRYQHRMHRDIMNAPKCMEVDHINHNGLDNRKCNLRLVTRRENACNRTDKAKYPGVRLHSKKKYRARIYINGKYKHLGVFDTQELAHQAYINECVNITNK